MSKYSTMNLPPSLEKEWDITKLITWGEHKRTYLLKKQIGNDSCILQIIPQYNFSKAKYHRICHLSHNYLVLPSEWIHHKGNDFILYSKLLTLQEILADQGLSLENIFQLGIDMTCAIIELMQNQIFTADISPTNIYRGQDGHFCLGDLDLLRTSTGTTPEYTAPEKDKCHKKIFCKGNHAASFDLSMQYAIGKLLLTLLQLCSEFDTKENTCIPAKACAVQPEHRFASLMEFQKEMKKFSHSPAVDIPSSILHIKRKEHALFQIKTVKRKTKKEKLFFPVLWSSMILASCILLILLIFCQEPQEKKNPSSVYELHQIENDKETLPPEKTNELDLQRKKLSTLDDAIASLSFEGIENSPEYDSVEYLYAGENELTEISSVNLFPHIKEIYLNQNQLQNKDSLLPLLQLKELEVLVLSHNNLQELPNLSPLKNLIHLDLSSNPKLRDINMLSDLTQLRFLNLTDTGIRKRDIQTLRTKLPECEIIS